MRTVTDRKEWNTLVESTNQSVLHYWEWGSVKSPTWSPIYFVSNNTPILILKRANPIIGGELGYIPPVKINHNLFKNVLKDIKEITKQEGLTHIIMDSTSVDSQTAEVLKQEGFKEYFEELQPRNTNIITLKDRTEEEVFNKIKGKYRREVRKAKNDGYVVTSYNNSEQEALDGFYTIMQDVMQRGSYMTYKKEYFEKMWKQYSSINRATIHLCHHKDSPEEVLGTYLVLHDSQGSFELYGGTNTAGRNARIAYLLKWSSIQDSHSKGKLFYDQWGTAKLINNEFDPKDPYYHISVFKKAFGGKHTTFIPPHVYVNSPLKYTIFRMGMWLKNIVIGLRKKF